ncbi:MAG TPA: putative Ig domain-containing protein, partial [Methylophilus sp.]
DAVNTTSTQVFSITVTSPNITLSPSTLNDATAGKSFSTLLSPAGGTGPYTCSVSAGSLPAGVSLSSSPACTLSGTPTTSGSYSFSVTATDSNGNSGSQSYALTVVPALEANIAIASTTLTVNVAATAFTPVTASGGKPAYSYAIAPVLPTGLTLNSSTGEISGTPTVTASSASYTVTITDALGNTASKSITLAVQAPGITLSPATLPDGNVNTAYSVSLSASGGTSPYTYTVTTGSLPAGLTLNSNGTLSGTPTAAGTSSFTVTATDAHSFTGTRAYSLQVTSNIAIAPASLNSGVATTPYSASLSSTGGVAPYSYSVTAGSLPAGLTLSATGSLSGTATVAGTFNFTVTATDATSATATRAYTLVMAAPTLSISPASLTAAQVNTAYTQSLSSSGGAAPYTYSVTSGSLPTGLTLSSAGVLSGTPTTPGSYTLTVTATDAYGFTAAQAYTLSVASNITVSPASLPAGTGGTSYSSSLSASGGASPYTYAISTGALPAGLSMSAGGVISGTPTVAGTFNFSVLVTDNLGATTTVSYSLVIAAPTLSIAPTNLTTGTTGTAYTQTLTTTGGTGPYQYAVTSGSLPAGLSLSAAGNLTGTPTSNGSYSFTVTSTDAYGFTSSKSYSLTIGNGLATSLAVASYSLTTHVAMTASQPVTASGGTSPYLFAVSPALPAGLSMSASGQLSGTPTAATATSNYTVTVTDAVNTTSTQVFSITVTSPNITLSPSTLNDATINTAYSLSLSASGGTSPYTYAVTTGSLPAGLSLNTDGTLSGTPTASGNSSFTITATDANGLTGQRAYQLHVNGSMAGTVQIPTKAMTMSGGTPFTPVTASGGTTPYAFAIAPTLPSGLAMSPSTGSISGTPAVTSAPTTYTVTITDAASATVSRTFVLNVAAGAVAITPVPTMQPNASGNLTQQIAATGGVAPYTFMASGLPAGLTLATNGLLTGMMSQPGQYSFTVTVTDANGMTASATMNILVAALDDPTKNAQVIALANAQLMASQRFVSSQSMNIFSRLDRTRDCSRPGADLTLPVPVRLSPSGAALDCDGGLSGWVGGNIGYGSDGNNSHRFRFNSPGLSFGTDMRISPDLMLGISLGYGHDRSATAGDAAVSRANFYSVATYASYHLSEKLYLDGALGYGKSYFSTSRDVVVDHATLHGDREGQQVFGSIRLTGVEMINSIKFAPFVRYDQLNGTLSHYAESGNSGQALSYDNMHFSRS